MTTNNTNQSVAIIVEGETTLLTGTIAYLNVEMKDLTRKQLLETYGYALFTEFVKDTIADFDLGTEAPQLLAKQLLASKYIRESVVEFNQNFCAGLTTGHSLIEGDTKYYPMTKEDSEAHKEALVTTLQAANLMDKYADLLTRNIEKSFSAGEESQVQEETVTITVAEYESLRSIEAVNDRNLELMAQLEARVKEYEVAIEGLGKQLDEKDAHIATLEKELTSVQTTTNTKEDTNMSTFKISVKSFKEVAVRETPENKVVSTSAIEGMDVGNLIKARVKAIEVSKGLNNKVREKSPETIVKVANATHTGIDAVANAAHKTTNVIAKSTNTVIQKSANAVDAVLDFVAPVEATVDMAAFNRMKSEAKDGDIVTVNGHEYEMKNGRLMAI